MFSFNPAHFSLIVGPCAVESHDTFSRVARFAKKLGVTALRGGIYKLRTDPQSFQGLGNRAFEIVQMSKDETGLPFICEVTDPRQIEELSRIADAFQVGTRNMHNYELLKELGRSKTPVLLKRGMSAYLDELLLASEYIRKEGNEQIAFCERGIRTFERATRNTLDLSAVPYLKSRSNLPVIVDPSHGTGKRNLVVPMCLAAAAAGADGLLIEVHPEPANSLSDAEQALGFDDFEKMHSKLVQILNVMGKTLEVRPS